MKRTAILLVLVLAACGGSPSKSPSAAKATSSTTAEATTTTEAPTTTTTAPPQPTHYQGHGDDVVAVTKPEPGGPAIAVFSHDGTANFIVDALDANRQDVGLGLVNEIGPFAGSRPLDMHDSDHTAYLKIQADGNWKVDLEPLSMARPVPLGTTGKGDDFFLYSGKGGVAHWTHSGTANFIIDDWSKSGDNNLVNEIGAYDGKVSMDGPGYIEVVADGPWTVSVQ